MAAVEALARHREKQFFMTVRIKKTLKFKTIFKYENFSSEKYFRKFLGGKFSENFLTQNRKFAKSENQTFFIKNRFFGFSIFCQKNFQNFLAQKFRKYFSDEFFSYLKIVLNFKVFLFEPSWKIVSPYVSPMLLPQPYS